MQKQVIAAAVGVLSLCAVSAATVQPESKSLLEKVAGTWTAEPFEVRLTSDLDVSVWGPNSSSLRRVEMMIQPSGEGHIKVTRSIVDAHGKAKPASVSVE